MNNDQLTTEKSIKSFWQSTSFKLITVGVLILILLIPSSMVQSIIHEREHLRSNAIMEVNQSWANEQNLTGPILSIPAIRRNMVDGKAVDIERTVHILPEGYIVEGEITPRTLRRGIYEVVVYDSELRCSGSLDISKAFEGRNYHEIRWSEAYMTIGISDLRGIQNQMTVEWNGNPMEVHPGSRIQSMVSSGVTVPLDLTEGKSDKVYTFAFDLDLQGSSNLTVVPVGTESDIRLRSDWPDPSFSGSFLPDEREVSEEGFSAHWNVLELNRNFPSHWVGSNVSNLSSAALGVTLMLPVDDYQKSLRSAKYAILTLGLTFLIFFLIEVLNKRRIHPFQYLLVGLALVLFYVLLVSISEHTNFNFAYLISSVSIVGLIGLYSTYIFRDRKQSLYLVLILAMLYLFVFVTLQLADYALLLGAVGLLVILATTMYVTRKIDWYSQAKSVADWVD